MRMGFFNFLKKKEPLSKPQSEELPPIPPVRRPETPQESPQLRASLPPLPPSFSMPDAPESRRPASAMKTKQEFPALPPIPTARQTKLEREIPSPEELPEKPGKVREVEDIPDSIPPLELKGDAFEPDEYRESIHSMHGPIFVRTDKFKAFLDDIEKVRTRFKEEENIFLRVNDIKNSEDKAFEGFRENIEDVQRKLMFVDKALFEEARW